MQINLSPKMSAGLLAVLAFSVAWTLAPSGAAGTDEAANRMHATGSALEVMSAPISSGSASEIVTLLTGTIKTSSPKDLVFRFTAECALWTDITTVGNDDSQAIATVKVWVEMDGNVIPVSSDDTGDDAGKVVLCNRAYRRVTTMFDDENATIETYLATRSANGFNWFTFDAGSFPSPHVIELKAQLETQVDGTGMAKAAVGKRTLIVEPASIANEATA